MTIKEIVAQVKEKMDANGGLKHVYFVACGGSRALLSPGYCMLLSEAETFSVNIYNSNEFVHVMPKQVGKNALVVVMSLKATAESVKAVEVANAAGAVTIAMTGNMETGMAKVGQYVITYSNGADMIYSQTNQANSLRLGFELLNQFEGYANYDKAMEGFTYLDEMIPQAKEDCTADAVEWAKRNYQKDVFYVMGSGANYFAAYSMACCHFMEMQWKHAVFLNDGEYFHGPFETTDEDLPMVLFMGTGRNRFMDQRALNFMEKHNKNHLVIDFEKINNGRIDASVAEFFSPLIFVPIERWYVYQMSLITDHDMDIRRYMYKEVY